MNPQAVGAGRTALIVGDGGQDGRLLAGLLRREGTRVVGVGRPAPGAGSDRTSVDVTVRDEVARLIAEVDPDEVYYLAAHHGSSESMGPGAGHGDVRDAWAVHVAGFTHVIDAVRARNREVRVLLAASCLAHGPGPGRIDEQSPLAPDTVYGATKAAAMLVARAARHAGGSIWTAVLFPHESGLRPPTFAASRIVRGALAVAEGRAAAVTIGDPAAVVDWSLATAVVEAFVGMLRSTPPDDYVVASGEGRTVGELADAVLRRLGLDPERHLRVDPDLLARPSARRVGDPTRLAGLLGWSGRPGLDEFATWLIADHRRVLGGAPAPVGSRP